MDVKIRNARHSDLESLAALLKERFAIEADFVADDHRQPRGLSLMLDGCGKHRCVKVAETGGRVVAMYTAQLLMSTAEGAFSALVEDVVVAENFRGQGIGRILLADAEAWARQHGATRLQLLTDKENRRTLRFFQKKRWTTTRLTCLRKAVGRDFR